MAAVELRRIALERYKGYARRVELELAPLTILVGPNNSGKTALGQAIQLLAGGFVSSDREAREPLPLESGGIRHGEAFEDLVTGRAVHGQLRFSLTLAGERGELSLSATVTNVVAPGRPSERQISDWRLRSDYGEIHAARQGFGGVSAYRISGAGARSDLRTVAWRGLIPQQWNELAEWIGPQVDALEAWAGGVRHLRCPRRLVSSPFLATEHSPASIGCDGGDAPLALAGDDALRDSVRNWYRNTFGVRIDVVAQGSYSNLVTGTPGRDDDVGIAESGRGLSHVLPVVVTALTARRAGAGVDVIEHPEAELHPAAHADIAELLMENLAGTHATSCRRDTVGDGAAPCSALGCGGAASGWTCAGLLDSRRAGAWIHGGENQHTRERRDGNLAGRRLHRGLRGDPRDSARREKAGAGPECEHS